MINPELEQTIEDFRAFTAGKKYKTILADPPWQFQNRTGKVAPEHKRLTRFGNRKLLDFIQFHSTVAYRTTTSRESGRPS